MQGQRSGSAVRLVRLGHDDPVVSLIGSRQRDAFATGGDTVYSTASNVRIYSKLEFLHAPFFQLSASTFFEPAGEEVGTRYDDLNACEFCGSTEQVGDLILRLGSMPKNVHVAQTIAGELIVSQYFVDAYHSIKGSGVEFLPVRAQSGAAISDWFQPCFGSARTQIHSSSIFGTDPFDNDEEGEYSCPLGHTLGLRQLSQLVLKKPDWGLDFARTDKLVGRRIGLLRPHPMYVISARLQNACATLTGKKLKVEPLRVVE